MNKIWETPQRAQGRSQNESLNKREKHRQRNQCSQRAKTGFKSIDLFGESVTLTWNGEEKYKTMIGAFLSAIILALVSIYSAYRLYAMVYKLSPLINRTTLMRLTEMDKPYRP